jgi:hypothetical protein
MDNSQTIADLLTRTAPDLARQIDVTWWQGEVQKQGARVAKFRRYVSGDHDSDMTAQMMRMLRIKADTAGLARFADNYCRIVVDKMSSRTSVEGFEIGDDEDAQEWLADIMERSDFDALIGTVIRSAIRDGEGYVSIDPQTLTWKSEPAYNGHSGVVSISVDDAIVWAVKLVASGAMEAADTEAETGQSYQQALTAWVYMPTRIQVFRGESGSLGDMAFVEAVDWTFVFVPIIDVANQRDSYTSHGDSELKPAIPLQDALNRTLHSTMMAEEFGAFGLRYSIGIAISDAAILPGSVVNVVPSGELTEENIALINATKVGEFGAVDMGQYIGVMDKLIREISQTTQTPIYGVTTEGSISGEALKQLEIGLIGKVERFQRENTSALKKLIRYTADIQDAFFNEAAPQIESIGVNWASAELRDAAAEVAMYIELMTKAPGLFPAEFYREHIGNALGLDNATIKRMAELAVMEQANTFMALTGGAGNVPLV